MARGMAQSLFITAMEAQSGKSIVALGFMEAFATRAQRAGFFRPIVPSATTPDPQTELIRRRYGLETPHEQMYALSAQEAQTMIAAGQHAELEQRVFDTYKELERRFDVMVVEGTDFAGVLPALEFDLNARLANQLGAPVLVVLRGTSVPNIAESVRIAKASLADRGCTLFGVVVNRVPDDVHDEIRAYSATYDPTAPMYVMTENESLERPTLRQIAEELHANVLVGGDGRLQQEVREVRVAAMSVEHFIEDLVDGTLVIVPGDRADILLASLASARFATLPAVAGIVLTGGHPPAPQIEKLLHDAPFGVLAVDHRTYPTATAVHAITPVITAEDELKIATALGVFAAAIAPAEVAERIALPRPRTRTPMMFQYELLELARSPRRHVVLPEGEDERVLRAADILLRRDVIDLTILGDPAGVQARAAAHGLTLDRAQIIAPSASPLHGQFAELYYELRKHRGMTRELAFDAVVDPSYFGALMVQTGAVDGMVSGAAHTTADTIRPAFEIIRARPGVSVISSVFFMCLADRVLVYGDCAVNPMPGARQLADIAIGSAATAASFGVEPRIAMLSYSTGTSGRGPQVTAVRQATEIVRERCPDLKVEGPIQYDAAVDAHVARLKLPGSEVAGRATVFIFPDLDTGNVAYKAVQRSAGAVAIGPVLQGLRKPINDLSRGCTIVDIVNTVAITAVQAQAEPAVVDRAQTPVSS
jgi:phosphate acetyltransferase